MRLSKRLSTAIYTGFRSRSIYHSNWPSGRVVELLEERHDTYMEGNPIASPLTGVDGQVPTADAIAAELERFLADRRPDVDPTAD